MLPACRRVPHDLEILAVDDPAVGLYIAVDQPLVEPVDGFDKRLGGSVGLCEKQTPELRPATSSCTTTAMALRPASRPSSCR